MRRAQTALTLGAALLAGCPAAAQRHEPVASEFTGRLGDAGIRESSGIAVSRRYDGVLWTHNDSGDDPLLYAVDWSGNLLRTFEVRGATAVDWEDIALGPCPEGMRPAEACLFIADVGDNEEQRADVAIYIVPEPDPHAGPGPAATEPARVLQARYPDGARDAEAIAVDPDGNLALITKGRSGPIVLYAVPRVTLLADSVVLAALDTVPLQPFPMLGRWITSAAISPSGERLVLGTHTELYFFRHTDSGWARVGEACWLGLPPRQWEAADFIDEYSIVVTSEEGAAAEGVIRRVRC